MALNKACLVEVIFLLLCFYFSALSQGSREAPQLTIDDPHLLLIGPFAHPSGSHVEFFRDLEGHRARELAIEGPIL